MIIQRGLLSPLSSPDTESEGGSDAEWEVTLTHGDLPVYSHDAQPVEPVDALLKALTCPAPLLADAPPTMVTENYCFVLDGDKVNFQDLMDQKLWKPTSSPVRYYFSEDMKSFHRVHIVLIRGRVISAVLRIKKPGSKKLEHRPVPLDKVFRVSRHFSHWKSCLKFHKIVSKVSPITENPPSPRSWSETGELPRRIFVQYLWRDAKESEKLRVALEYDATLRRAASVSSLPPIPDAVLARGRRKTLGTVLGPGDMRRSLSARSSGPLVSPPPTLPSSPTTPPPSTSREI